MIIKKFGHAIVNDQGKIDRAKLGELVFSSPEQRRKLNKISHPKIFRRIIGQLFRLKFVEKKQHVVLNAPLLFETNMLEYVCYPIIVVHVDDVQVQLQR